MGISWTGGGPKVSGSIQKRFELGLDTVGWTGNKISKLEEQLWLPRK